MTCPACGAPNRDDASFCGTCGATLGRTLACDNCGRDNPAHSRFCDRCGAALASTDAPTQVPVAAPEAERRTVSVLFADAEASTELGDRLDAEEIYRLVQDAVSAMVDAVDAHRGMVTQFTGDGVMALFGAPVSHENSPRDAVAAALAMQKTLEAQADRLRADGLSGMRFRVGLHTGPVVVGRINDRLGLDYTALGDTANVASRVESSADAGSVFITDHTWRLVDGFFDAERVGPMQLKGKDAPIVLWRVTGDTGARSRLDAATRRGLTPLVGRAHELATLEGHLSEATRGRGRTVVVTGEPGVGKSRLVRELRARTSVPWYEAGCAASGTAVSYLAISDLLRRVFGVEEDDSSTAIVDRVDGAVATWSPTAVEIAPLLRVLLTVDSGADEVDRLSPADRANRTIDAVRLLVAELTTSGPVVVVIEDLHWVDERSDEALVALAEAIAALPVLLLLTTRPGHKSAVAARDDVHRVAVGPLDRSEAEQVAAHVLATDVLPGELAVVVEKADGNPFFIEEATKSLLESGAVLTADDGPVLVVSVDESQVPDTVLEVILARIDRLDAEARAALQLAAVIGREFTVRLLGRVSGLDATLGGHLAELQAVELILERSRFPELSYLFKHALTHDVAYSTLLIERRRALHLVVARATEELYADRLPEHYEMLAHHYSEAQAWPEAYAYGIRAARKSEDAYATRDALVYHDLALTAAEHLDTAPPGLPEAFETAAEDAILVGDLGLMFELPDRVIRLGQALGDTAVEASGLVQRAYVRYLAHEFSAAEDDANRALAIDDSPAVRAAAKSHLYNMFAIIGRHEPLDGLRAEIEPLLGDADGMGNVLSRMMTAFLENWRGRFDECIELTEQVRAYDIPANQVVGLTWMETLAIIGSGEYERAYRMVTEALALAETHGDVFYGARLLNSVGWLYAEMLDHETALDWNERSLAKGIETPSLDHEIECQARLNIADNLLSLGRFDEAEAHFVVVQSVVDDDVEAELWAKWRYRQHHAASLGSLRFAQGRHDKALSLAAECVEWADRYQSAKNLAKGWRLRGEVLRALGHDAEAATALDTALAHAEFTGNPTQRWLCLAAVGRYRDALDVIESVAADLAPERGDRMLAAPEVAALQQQI